MFHRSQEPIQQWLAKCEQPFAKSQLFLTSTKTKVVDEDKRRSQYRAITDEKIFELSEALIEHLNTKDEEHDFTLVKNDVTQIKYNEGDFFEKHEDYLSVTSNVIQVIKLVFFLKPLCSLVIIFSFRNGHFW